MADKTYKIGTDIYDIPETERSEERRVGKECTG